jgi:phosphoketolase
VDQVLDDDELAAIDAYWRAANYVSVGQIYLMDNPLLREADHLSPDGRVMEVLSEHLCQGWLEGYLLTGRHGPNARLFAREYTREHGEDDPAISGWIWGSQD